MTQALAALAAGGLDAAAAYAWPSGDWTQVHDAAADDPQRLAMAGYMAAASRRAPRRSRRPTRRRWRRSRRSRSRCRASIARASGGARLLSAGPEIGGFVEAVLAEE